MTDQPLNWQKLERHKALDSYCFETPAGSLKIDMQGKTFCQMQWLFTSPGLTLLTLPEDLQNTLQHFWLFPKKAITTPLLFQGTAFQRKVWMSLIQIPLGQTTTYGTLASQLNTSPRALANACRRNPFPLIIPCHRVLAKTGIGGYAGETSGKLIDIKQALLAYERKIAHEI